MKKINTPTGNLMLTLGIIVLLFLTENLLGQHTWTGAADTVWSNPLNWNPNAVPDGTQDIFIPNVANQPTASGIQIDIAAGVLLTIDPGATLTINGQNVVGTGLRNLGNVTLSVGAFLSIDSIQFNGIENTGDGIFNNFGTIHIGFLSTNGFIGNAALWNNSTNSVFNNMGGAISIQGTGNVNSIFGQGIALERGRFENYGNIEINGTTQDGINNGLSGVFTNHMAGTIAIGINAPIGRHGIYNADATVKNFGFLDIMNSIDGIQLQSDGIFNNEGDITISNTIASSIALVQASAFMSNKGQLQLSMAGHHGIWNQGTFCNNNSGEINISTTIQPNINVRETGIFVNKRCAYITGDALMRLAPQAQLVNRGYLGFDNFIIDATSFFDNCNGYVYDVSAAFNCGTYGGTCLGAPLTYSDFTTTGTYCFNPLIVTSTADAGAGSLRESVLLACPGDTIMFDENMVIGPIMLDTTITLDKDLIICGLKNTVTIIDGSNDNDFSLFALSDGAAVEFFDLYFMNGGGPNTSRGGAINTENDNSVDQNQLKVTRCYFENNQANFIGGAINSYYCTTEIFNSEFKNNYSDFCGGAINHERDAGSILNISITNCLFTGNKADFCGGAVNISFNSSGSIVNSTLTENESFLGGAINYNSDISLLNSILYNNKSSFSGPDILKESGILNAQNNLIGDYTDSGVLAGTNSNITGDPMFIDTASDDYRLMPSSPCIDIGSPNVFYTPEFLDLAGNPRVFGPEEDLGAYETSANGAGATCLTTLFVSDNGQSGNMFTINNASNKSIWIDSFYVNLFTGTWDMEVYYTTTTGTHTGSEMDAGAWTLLGSAAAITSEGIDQPTLLPIGGLILNGGQSKGLYITVTGGTGVGYTNDAASEIISDGILEIDLVNNPTGNAYPFGAVFTPRRWNGTICYHIPDACPYDRLLPFDPMITGIYEAENTILSTGRVAAGTIVSYGAAVSTQLDNGFEVEQGATFYVQNDGCTNQVKSILTPASPISVIGSPNSPLNEEFDKIIDGDINTKFYNQVNVDPELAFVVDAVIPEIVTSLEVTTANDVPDRDPTFFEIQGSFDNILFFPIASGNIPCIPDRLTARMFPFANDIPYRYYKFRFTEECTAISGLQLSEVQLYAKDFDP